MATAKPRPITMAIGFVHKISNGFTVLDRLFSTKIFEL